MKALIAATVLLASTSAHAAYVRTIEVSGSGKADEAIYDWTSVRARGQINSCITRREDDRPEFGCPDICGFSPEGGPSIAFADTR